MPRKPKGSYTRHTTDWFLDRMAIGGAFYQSNNGSRSAVDLYNNAQDGSNFHVYKLWVGNGAGGQYHVTRQPGWLNGTQVLPYPVLADGPQPPGLISYADIAGNAPTPFNPFGYGAYIAMNNDAGTMDIFDGPGPICVLTPGTSLRVFWHSQVLSSNTQLAVSFFYAWLTDKG